MKARCMILISLLMMGSMLVQASAQVSMSPLFTDHMVLQQRTDAPVWGTAEPGSTVTVYTSWNRAKYSAEAGNDGKWLVKVRTPKAGGPYEMTVSDGKSSPVKISDILIGEVWLCSGQSNMEMPVGGWGKVMNYEQEIAAADYPKIRLMEVQRNVSPVPVEDFKADADGWMVCSPESVVEFSATAYFFGRELQKNRNVPVGLINTSWGGTVIEAWISHGALAGVKDLEQMADMVAGWPVSMEERKADYEKGVADWTRLNEAFDAAAMNLHKNFASCGQNDSDWQIMTLPGMIETVYPGFDGHVLLRKNVEIPQSWAGKPLVIHMPFVGNADMTYFNGKLVGERSGGREPRAYTVPAELVHEGTATVAIRLMNRQSRGGVFGREDGFFIEGPDSERISLAGEWRSLAAADSRSLPARPINMVDDPNWSTVLYNGMIAPLVPFAVKGAIWYQGCSNVGRAEQYRDLMTLMIEDWRSAWGYDFPFYITQLANYQTRQTEPENSSWAELREAQDIASQVTSNTGLAVIIDIGEAMDIHPKNKQEVGRRLALQAMAGAYDMPVLASGPVFDRYEIDGDVIRIYFSSVGKGLKAKGGSLEGFAIAGADRKFHWAEAKISGNCVEVRCDDVAMPLAVRYAWGDNPLGNLYNAAGLPAGPFRTDIW